MNSDTWTTLPQCPAFHQGLAAFNGELISVGGVQLREAANIVYTFRRGKWVDILPPMPTPRYLLSITSHKNELILAAGGITGITLEGIDLRTTIHQGETAVVCHKEIAISISCHFNVHCQ